MLDKLFDEFLREKKYIQNCSKNTLRFYDRAYKTYRKVIESDAVPTQESLNDFIVKQRERGMSVGCLNVHIRGVRAFVRWLIANKHADATLHLSELRDVKKVLRSFTDEELIKFIRFRPKTFTERRTHTL